MLPAGGPAIVTLFSVDEVMDGRRRTINHLINNKCRYFYSNHCMWYHIVRLYDIMVDAQAIHLTGICAPKAVALSGAICIALSKC